ncbi:XIAP-associated factor 1 [Phalaenopsis equestris]|uniref:XIAP-associated factor 1 n=1 Tax=Phalaenopsis equestris TaxID=78828 RepID=UPI0009E63214|nr:XIAP-associated factor 1 [Phalaenopsis equestris]
MAIASDSMTTICSHCERDIPTVNIQLHQAHCSRNLQKCSICGEIVPIKHADEHFKESHAPIDCSLCSETIEREGWSLHQDEKCPKRIVTCEFCEFLLPAADLYEHQEVCGNRTELCHTCNKYIRLRELIRHEVNCQSHSDGLAESSGSRNESLVDREGVRRRQANNSEASQRSDDGDDSPGEAARRRRTRATSQRRIIYTIALTGFAMLIGSFFLSRRG